MLSYQNLKKKQRSLRENFEENLGLRVHRALSWLHRAEQSTDIDGKYIFLWIAFNAAYANDLGEHALSETRLHQQFIDKIIALDQNQYLYELLWQNYSSKVRLILDNPYLFQPYWNWVNDIAEADETQWQEKFKAAKQKAHISLANKDTATVYSILLSRLYTLRNQLMHGGATFNSKINRKQLQDATHILQDMVPMIIHIMMDNAGELWGDACYKVQGGA